MGGVQSEKLVLALLLTLHAIIGCHVCEDLEYIQHRYQRQSSIAATYLSFKAATFVKQHGPKMHKWFFGSFALERRIKTINKKLICVDAKLCWWAIQKERCGGHWVASLAVCIAYSWSCMGNIKGKPRFKKNVRAKEEELNNDRRPLPLVRHCQSATATATHGMLATVWVGAKDYVDWLFWVMVSTGLRLFHPWHVEMGVSKLYENMPKICTSRTKS